VFLVDASVWVALAAPAEPFHLQAEALVGSEHSLAALDLTLYEVANAVGVKMANPARAARIGRIIARRCESRVAAIDREQLESIADVAIHHGLSAYDAAYVAAARRHGWQLVSIDHRDLVSKGLAVTPDAAV